MWRDPLGSIGEAVANLLDDAFERIIQRVADLLDCLLEVALQRDDGGVEHRVLLPGEEFVESLLRVRVGD